MNKNKNKSTMNKTELNNLNQMNNCKTWVKMFKFTPNYLLPRRTFALYKQIDGLVKSSRSV